MSCSRQRVCDHPRPADVVHATERRGKSETKSARANRPCEPERYAPTTPDSPRHPKTSRTVHGPFKTRTIRHGPSLSTGTGRFQIHTTRPLVTDGLTQPTLSIPNRSDARLLHSGFRARSADGHAHPRGDPGPWVHASSCLLSRWFPLLEPLRAFVRSNPDPGSKGAKIYLSQSRATPPRAAPACSTLHHAHRGSLCRVYRAARIGPLAQTLRAQLPICARLRPGYGGAGPHGGPESRSRGRQGEERHLLR